MSEPQDPGRGRRLRPRYLVVVLVVAVLVVGLALSRTRGAAAPTAVTGTDYLGIAAGSYLPGLPEPELHRELDGIAATGARWLRADLQWDLVQQAGPRAYAWAPYDRLVDAARDRRLKLVLILDGTPSWARAAPTCVGTLCAPDPAHAGEFRSFAAAAAARYASRGVRHWEIWNEPNIAHRWQPRADVRAYSAFLEAGYAGVKRADRGAVVISGGLSPAETASGDVSPYDFLAGLYDAGAGRSFDAVGHHPYCYRGDFDCPAAYAPWSAWSQMFATPLNLRSLMIARGDGGKKIWGTEFGAPTRGGAAAVDEAHQARMLAQAYDLWWSYPWTGPLLWYSYRDRGTDTADYESAFGLVRADRSPKPARAAYREARDRARALQPGKGRVRAQGRVRVSQSVE